MHKAGFINIMGYPNVGKSTLMNAMLGDKLSIITSKPQTTRHRILGIYNDDDYQMVFSDTPGIIDDPSYSMQSAMNSFAFSSLEDADIILLITDPYDEYTGDENIIQSLQGVDFPVFLIVNKIDLVDEQRVKNVISSWEKVSSFQEVIPISAKENTGVQELIDKIKPLLPESPPFYPKDQLSDRSVRFFVSEIIREKILQQFKQEIPYSCEVIIEEFHEKDNLEYNITKIHASIIVSRNTQKSILIGKGGASIKKLGIAARAEIEKFLDEKIFLELKVKVKENWRNDDRMLIYFGYKH